MGADVPPGGIGSPARDPWYRLGAWLVLYGTVVGAPSGAVAGLLALASVAGLFPLPGEFYLTAALAGVSLPAVAVGWFLRWRSRRAYLRLQTFDDIQRGGRDR